jgi:hypothetical protein
MGLELEASSSSRKTSTTKMEEEEQPNGAAAAHLPGVRLGMGMRKNWEEEAD